MLFRSPPQELPVITVGDKYLIGIEDVLEVTMAWGNQTLSHTVTVRPDGEISLPMIADVQAKDLSLIQLEESITERLNKFVYNPDVTIIVKEINGKKVAPSMPPKELAVDTVGKKDLLGIENVVEVTMGGDHETL